MHRQDRILDALDLEHLQTAGKDMLADDVDGHVAPPEAGEQEFQARAEVGEPPDVVADDAAGQPDGDLRPVGEDELDLGLEIPARQLTALGQRMVGRDHGHRRDVDQKLGLVVGGKRQEGNIEAEPGDAVAQPLFGASEPLGEERDGKSGKGLAERTQADHQHAVRKDRFDRQRQLRLDVLDDRLGARLEGLGPVDHAARVLEDDAAGVIQLRYLAVPLEQRRAERRFQRLDRLADRRLDAPQPTGGSRKTTGLDDRDQARAFDRGSIYRA